jgi:hypothetical protein
LGERAGLLPQGNRGAEDDGSKRKGERVRQCPSNHDARKEPGSDNLEQSVHEKLALPRAGRGPNATKREDGKYWIDRAERKKLWVDYNRDWLRGAMN